jgi:hypothetical protein
VKHATRPHPGFRFSEHVLTQPLIVPGLASYAITTDRRFPHPMLSSLFDRAGADFLAA